MKEQLVAAGGVETGYDQAPVGAADFSSFILKIRQANPDVVVTGIAGGDMIRLMTQWRTLG
jgi:branched-chain amino acid transport system substrate-binding protein